MERYAAFLRGVNLGRRTVKSADLKAAFEALGFQHVKTLLASGNVLFDVEEEKGLQARIEAQLEKQFGFVVGTVLRKVGDLQAVAGSDPFGGRKENEEQKLYVMLLAEPLPKELKLAGIAGDFEIAGTGRREIYVVAYRKPSGRYGEGMGSLEKQLPKGTLVTTRNWNTLLKAM